MTIVSFINSSIADSDNNDVEFTARVMEVHMFKFVNSFQRNNQMLEYSD